MTKKIEVTARLENWYTDPLWRIIWGDCYDDSKKRFEDGWRIHTSSIPDFAKNNKKWRKGSKVKTLNSVYLLGSKRRLKK